MITPANYTSSPSSANPRKLWYAPDRRLRAKRASAEAVSIVEWIQTGLGRDVEPDEGSLFAALHTCAYQAARRRDRTRVPEAQRVRWADRWQIIRACLVEKNLGLVYSTVRRFGSRSIDADDLLSDALYALTRAVDRFNPWKGFRFSTYACNVIVRALMRRVRQESKYRQLFPARYQVVPDRPEGLPDFQAEVYIERLKRARDWNLGNLSSLESHILAQRFPTEPKTQLSLQKVGDGVGLSKERVRQIEKRAIRKLREVLDQDPVLQ